MRTTVCRSASGSCCSATSRAQSRRRSWYRKRSSDTSSSRLASSSSPTNAATRAASPGPAPATAATRSTPNSVPGCRASLRYSTDASGVSAWYENWNVVLTDKPSTVESRASRCASSASSATIRRSVSLGRETSRPAATTSAMGNPPQIPASSSAGPDSRRIRSGPTARPSNSTACVVGNGPTSNRRAPSGNKPVNRRRLVTTTAVDVEAGSRCLTWPAENASSSSTNRDLFAVTER
ncbi:hypothetical protein ABUL04_28485 [Micromonospora harpali]|uniref:Uncharacterized protein n=1 Tax=Micromonospora harpali TaxID=1490225 RepID=A0ABW1HL20_9ACTN